MIGAQFFCGMSSVTSNSRMIYAFSRDGALPGSSLWHRISTRTRTPTNAVWPAVGGAFILGLPYLINPTAYGAVTSIAVIGLFIAYVIPVFLRLRQGSVQPGPVAPGPLERADRHHRLRLGRPHHDLTGSAATETAWTQDSRRAPFRHGIDNCHFLA